MKTIMNIVIILLVAAVVAAGFYLVVNNTAEVDFAEEGRERPAMMTSPDGTRPERPEGMPDRDGDEHGASIGQGLAGVGGSLLKLSVIVGIVLLIQKGIALVSSRRQPKVSA